MECESKITVLIEKKKTVLIKLEKILVTFPLKKPVNNNSKNLGSIFKLKLWDLFIYFFYTSFLVQ